MTYDGSYGRMGEDHDFGYIGRSMGNPNYPNGGVKAPILVHNSRSSGGETLFDDHIIKVETSKGGSLLWQRRVEKPKAPVPVPVLTRDDARLICDFMNGDVSAEEGGMPAGLDVALAKLEAIANREESTD